mgnify:CR=1 FL=1
MERDLVTPTVAVLVLLAILGFTFTADRDDKAWKAMTTMFGGSAPAADADAEER